MIYRTGQLLWGEYYNQSPFQATTMISQMGNQEEKCSDLSSLRKPVPVPIPSHSRQIIGYWTAFLKKKKKKRVQSAYWAFLFLSGIDKLRARTELFQTIERNLCCDKEPRHRKGKRRRSRERRLIFREEILVEWRCLKGIAVTFATWYAISSFFHTFSKKSSVKLIASSCTADWNWFSSTAFKPGMQPQSGPSVRAYGYCQEPCHI